MKTLIINRIKALQHAVDGLLEWVWNEVHPKIHFAILLVNVALGLYFHITKSEWIVLLMAQGMVLACEAINSSIESVVDLVSPGYHPLARKAKDIAAGAVLITATFAAIVSVLVFFEDLWEEMTYRLWQ